VILSERDFTQAILDELPDVCHLPKVALTDVQVRRIVAGAARSDAAGVGVGAEGWVPTYDFDAAMRDALRALSVKAARLTDYQQDGVTVKRADVRKAIEEARKLYMGGLGSMRLGPTVTEDQLAAVRP
jgi:hypothetical protein